MRHSSFDGTNNAAHTENCDAKNSHVINQCNKYKTRLLSANMNEKLYNITQRPTPPLGLCLLSAQLIRKHVAQMHVALVCLGSAVLLAGGDYGKGTVSWVVFIYCAQSCFNKHFALRNGYCHGHFHKAYLSYYATVSHHRHQFPWIAAHVDIVYQTSHGYSTLMISHNDPSVQLKNQLAMRYPHHHALEHWSVPP